MGRRLACFALAIFLVPAAAAAETPIWTGQTNTLFNGGFDVVPSHTPGMAYVLVGNGGTYPSYTREVLVFRAGPGYSSGVYLSLTDSGVTYERNFGADLACVGDVDGDLNDDFVVCAPLYQSSYEPTIPAGFYFYRGGAALDAVPDLTVLMMAGEYRLIARGVCGGGDFNGDGYDDFAISAWRGDVPVALIWFGGPGMDETPDMEIANVQIWTSRDTRSVFADLNGDGVDDLVANATDDGTSGLINVYYGAALPLPTPSVVLDGGTNGASLGTGDVNRDGWDDLLVAGYGQAQVYYGGPSWSPQPATTFLEDADRFYLRGQARIRAIHADARDAMAQVFVDASYGKSVVAFDVANSGTAVPDYVFPSDGSAIYNSFTSVFTTAPDLDGDGAEELAILDEAYRIHITKDLFFDCNANGQPDNDEVAGGLLPDCNANGLNDACELTVWPDLDCNGDGMPDECQLATMDCDGDGWLDVCQIASYPWLDCDDDGVLDDCLAPAAYFDCDGNGVPDCREIHDQPSLDCTGDGILDACQYEQPFVDCNGNGTPDFCEIHSVPSRDCNHDGTLDACQAPLPGYDCNANGILDTCEGIAEMAVDCDHDGRSDLCQVRQDRSGDCDASGFPDACEGSPPRSPCLPWPYVGVYFDADLTVTNLPAVTPQTVGDLYIALRGVEPDRVGGLQGFALSLDVPAGITILGTSSYPAGGVDLSPAANDWFVSLNTPFDGGPGGEVVLVHAMYFVEADPGPDARLHLRGSAANAVSTIWPTFDDANSGLNRVLDVRSAWFGLTFADCNDNGIDDADDLAAGRLTDLNGDQIPDQCQGLSPVPAAAPLALDPAAPNPFNPMTTIGFSLPADGPVLLTVHDAAGRRVATLMDAVLPAGPHRGVWRGRTDGGTAAASGVYFVRLKVGGGVLTRKIALLR